MNMPAARDTDSKNMPAHTHTHINQSVNLAHLIPFLSFLFL